MSNNYFNHPFNDFSESASQNPKGNLLTNLIQDKKSSLPSLPNFIERFSETPAAYLQQYLMEDPKQFRNKPINHQPSHSINHQQFVNNNQKDPRIKSEFYQEKPNFFPNQSNMDSVEEVFQPQTDIFKRDFIPFKSKANRNSDLEELEELEYDKFNVNSKKIKKLKPPVKNQHFKPPPPPNQGGATFNQNIRHPQITSQYQEDKNYVGKHFFELIHETAKRLPIFNRCTVILDAIDKEQVVVISGDTGCGKSTQVPKYIFLDARIKKKPVKIVCTQPRRMAALNLAKRVASELGEIVGGTVGYQISLDSRQQEATAILYVTNGIFLQSLIHDKNIFEQVTHVILDEIHERDIDSDFTMIAMKHLLKDNPKLKLILMSATINTQLFVNYFSRDEIQNCHNKEYNYELNANSKKWEKLNNWDDYDPKIAYLNKEAMEEEHPWTNIKIKKEREANPYGANRKIEASSEIHAENYNIHMNDLPACHVEITSITEGFKVGNFYIDTIECFKGHKEDKQRQANQRQANQRQNNQRQAEMEVGNQMTNGIEFRYIDFDRKKPNLHYECVQLAMEIIKFILKTDDLEKQRLNRKEYPISIDGSILIFLPGLNEINSFILKLEESLKVEQLKQLKIIPLHSALPDSQNQQIFDKHQWGHRKIIVSTNIAESSITVPNIVYVIDFCLSKETNYNPYNSMEKLELCWASRASAIQRAGRTGRVCDGYCFRLVPQRFFEDHLLAFTTPELLRSPLDKLILRIKTINEDDPKDLFNDPQKVLGRAIQPPHIDNISYALKSLQDSGALTWSIDKSYKSCKITQLGKIYCDLPCDIRICKLCIMGFIFNCLQEAVTIASILQHQKTMFIMNTRMNPRDQSKFYKNISSYDRGSNSDLILMLNIFNEWEERFGSLARLAQRKDHFSPDHFNAKVLKRMIKSNRVDDDEKRWCKDNFLDPIVLREILIQREDIKQRLQKFNFQENHYKSYIKENQTTYIKLKILFASSFNNNFLKAYQKWDLKLEKKLFNLKTSFNINTKCALIVTYSGFNAENLTPQQVTNKENEWKSFFESYAFVEKIKFNYNEAYIIFKENGSEEAIKYLLYKKAINNSLKPINVKEESYQEKKQQTMDTREPFKKNPKYLIPEEKEKIFLESIGAFDYLHLCQFNDLLRSHPVQIDNDSINKFVFSNSPYIANTSTTAFPNPFRKQDTIIPEQRQEPRILICFDYQERNNNKHYTRYTTLLPDFPLLAPLLLLIFSALPQLKISGDKARYDKVMIDEHEISLDYFLTEKEIEDINNLRSYLRDNLTAEALSKAPTDSFWNMLMELLTRERVKYYEPEVWEDAFKKQTKNSLIFDNFLNQNNAKNKELQCVTKFIRTQGKAIGNPASSNENKKIIDFQIYLPNIEKIALEYHSNFDISREEGKLMYKMYQDSYNQWKLKILEEINTHKKFLELKQTFLACGKCKLPISDIKNLKDKDADIFFLRKFIPNPYDVSTLNFNADDDFCSSEQYFEVDELFGKDLEFYACRNDHIMGIRPKNADSNDWFIYITEHSNLIVLYPDLTEEVFDFFKFDMKRTLEMENHKFKKKKQIIIDMKYDCHICQEFNMVGAAFLYHIKEGKKHKETLQEFQASLKKTIG